MARFTRYKKNGSTAQESRSYPTASELKRGAERLIPMAVVRGITERGGPMGQGEMAALSGLCQVPERYAAWWVEDLDNRGVLLPRRFQ